jgi:hypothetical protein
MQSFYFTIFFCRRDRARPSLNRIHIQTYQLLQKSDRSSAEVSNLTGAAYRRQTMHFDYEQKISTWAGSGYDLTN